MTFQTRPLARATGALAKVHIKTIISLMELSDSLSQEINTIDKKICDDAENLEELIEAREHCSSRRTQVNRQVAEKRAALGLQDQRDLHKLMNDKYLQARLKALAVKERLRAKLQGRKFELERVDKAYQQSPISANGMTSVRFLVLLSDALQSQIYRRTSTRRSDGTNHPSHRCSGSLTTCVLNCTT